MIAFVTTIRHPHNSSDYERVGQLLSDSLRSVVRQRNEDLVVVVVHNERPIVSVEDPRIHYVQVDFDRPSEESGPMIGFSEFVRDKGTKCAVGVDAARELGADHVMFFDADDLVSRRIAELVNSDPEHPGWYFPSGYIHSVGTRSVQPVPEGFHEKNGSTSVIRLDLIGLPLSVSRRSTQEEIMAACGTDLIDHMLGKHGYWHRRLAEFGSTMDPLPFPGAIWMIGTGENHSGNLVSARELQPITSTVTAEFGLERPTVPTYLAAIARLRVVQLNRRLGRR